MKKSPEQFEAEARLLLAVKLYELEQVTTGTAARLAGMGRVAFQLLAPLKGFDP